MGGRSRSNPLALAVLICLAERPMHPYEVATTLRQRQKHDSVRLNYGSLYSVVASLEKRGLIDPLETERAGRLPERTVYQLTDAGRIELQDWLTDLISTPVRDYTSFEAALSFLPALPPGDVSELLRERALRLEVDLAQANGSPRAGREARLAPLVLGRRRVSQRVTRDRAAVRAAAHPRHRGRDSRGPRLLARGPQRGQSNGVEPHVHRPAARARRPGMPG